MSDKLFQMKFEKKQTKEVGGIETGDVISLKVEESIFSTRRNPDLFKVENGSVLISLPVAYKGKKGRVFNVSKQFEIYAGELKENGAK